MSRLVGACLLLLTGASATPACTFPDVEYADAGATTITTSSGGCAVPAACAKNADTCKVAAKKAHTDCRQPCKNDTSCIALCDSASSAALDACVDDCEACTECTPNTCMTLVMQ